MKTRFRIFLLVIFSLSRIPVAQGQYLASQQLAHIQLNIQKAHGDSLKMEYLGTLARCYIHTLGDFGKADSICERVISMGFKTKDPNLQMLAYAICFEGNDFEYNLPKIMRYAKETEALLPSVTNLALLCRINLSLSDIYLFDRKQSLALTYAYKALSYSLASGNTSLQSGCLLAIGRCQDARALKIDAFRNYLDALNLAESTNDIHRMSESYKQLALFYKKNKQFEKSRYYKKKEEALVMKTKPVDMLAWMWIQYDKLEMDFYAKSPAIPKNLIDRILDFAIENNQVLLKDYTIALYRSYLIANDRFHELYEWYNKDYPKELLALRTSDPLLYGRLKGYFCEVENKIDSASYYFEQTIALAEKNPNKILLSNFYIRYGQFLARHQKNEAAIRTFEKGYQAAQAVSYFEFMLAASRELELRYANLKDYAHAYQYALKSKVLADSLFNDEKSKKIMQLQMQFEFDKKIQSDSVANANENRFIEIKLQKQKNLTYSGFIGLGLVVLLLTFVFINYQNQKEANRQIREHQEQLIHQEKLASLGLMSAGIAHEIRNPLNFINNFSAISIDLLEELRESTDQDQRLDVIKILENNLSKIVQHGSRAENIVKNMIDHSQNRAGEYERISMNELCTQTFIMAFQNVKALNPDFRCELIKTFQQIPKVRIISKELARVMLNLFNNSFYALQEKLKSDVSFSPKVEISTQLKDKTIEIAIRDNGIGIPAALKSKIFQPFFTTKPTGIGTGLGLSVSYDILHAHGGKLTFDSKEGEGATFILTLPVDLTV